MLTRKGRLFVARLLILVLISNPVIVAAHGVERAANIHLAEGQQANLKTSANGTTVIDIAAPSQRGVSHNRFDRFNVPAEGVIFNNSKDPLISVLGGWTDGNRRLAGGTAGLILAEVTGGTRSSLLGYTEILGDSAEFVLANPNGITCNGCGFINTPRVVLATGIPELINGQLTGLNISGGDVLIEGAGLNASNVSKFDILTRAMQLNAALYADELTIHTGNNYYDYRSGQASANSTHSGRAAEHQFALDASALGAMYANRISLIGTEAGLGVRSAGLISSANDLHISADGQLQLKHTVASGDLALRSDSAGVATSGTTYGNTVSIELPGTLTNTGLLAAADEMEITAGALQQQGDLIAGINLQGEWLDSATQQITIEGELVNQGRIISQGQQQLSAAQLNNTAGAVLQANTSTVEADVFENLGVVNSHQLTINADTAQNSGHIQAYQLTLNTPQFTSSDGVIYQYGADGNLSFTGQNLTLEGGLVLAEGAAYIHATEQLRNDSTVVIGGDVTITADEVNNSGTLQLLGQADVTADTFTNSGNALFSAEQGTNLTISDTLTNQGGFLQFGADTMVSATDIHNDGGQIYHLGDDVLLLQTEQQMANTGGQIVSNATLNLSAEQLENRQGAISAQQLSLSADHINNQSGTIQGDTVGISSTQLNNQQGTVVALGDIGESLQVNVTDTLDNSHGLILAQGQQLTLHSNSINNQQGSLILTGADGLTITANEHVDNAEGLIYSAGNLDISTPLLNNTLGEISANNMSVAASTLNNQQGVIGAQQLALEGFELNNQSGSIGAFSDTAENLVLTFAHSINNSNEGVIQSAGGTAQLTTQLLDNSEGSIVQAGQQSVLHISAETVLNAQGQIQSNGQLELIADSLHNQSGEVIALGRLNLAANEVDNSAGLLFADTLQLNTEGLTNTDGVIQAQQALEVNSTWLTNLRGVISASTFELNSDRLDNSEGLLLAASDLTINSQQLNNVDGVINSQGDLQLSVAELSNRAGVIQGVDSLIVQTHVADNQQGQLISGGNLQLHSDLLNNAHGLVTSGAQLALNITELHNTDGGVISGDQVTIAADTVNNDVQARIEGQQLQLTASSLNNAGIILAAEQQGESLVLQTDVLHNQGRIESHGENLTLSHVQINNQQGQIYHLGTGVLQLEYLETLNNHQGEIYSAAALALTGGDINNTEGALIAASDWRLQGAAVQNLGGVIHAGEHLDISADSLVNRDGDISAAGNFRLTVGENIDNSLAGVLTSGGAMSITAGSIDNHTGLIYQQGDGSLLMAVDGVLNNTEGTLAAVGELTIAAAELTNNAGLLQGEGVDLSLGGLNNQAGLISSSNQLSLTSSGILNNDHGQIIASDDITISATQISNQTGHIESSSTLTIDGDELNNDDGHVIANTLDLQLTGALSQHQGTLYATNNIRIDAASIDNTQGTIATDADLQLNVLTQLINEKGLLQAADTLTLNAQEIENSSGIIQAISAYLTAQQRLTNTDGEISGQTLVLTTNVLDNREGVLLAHGTDDHALQITGIDQLDNSDGTIASYGHNWDLALGNLNNDNGSLLHLGSGTFRLSQSGQLTNAGTIASNENLVLNADIVNNSGIIQAQQQLQLNAGLSNQADAVLVANDVNIQAAGEAITNAGTISATEQLQLEADSLTNSHLLYGGEHAQVNATLIDNSGVWSANQLDVSGFTVLQNSGQIESNSASYSGVTLQNQGVLVNVGENAGENTHSLALNVAELDNSGTLYNNAEDMSFGGNLNNSGSIIHAGSGNLLLGDAFQAGLFQQSQSAGNATINNEGGSIATAGTATLQNSILGAGTVFAEQGILIDSSDTFTNNSQLYTSGNMQVNSALNNQGGSLISDGELTINTSGNVTNTGLLQGQDLSLTAGVLNNNSGVITSLGTEGNSAHISAASLSNSQGVIQSNNESFTISTRNGVLNNSQGQISHSGQGTLTLNSAGNLNQSSGVIQTLGQLDLSAQGNVNNSSGVLAASQYQIVSSGTLTNNNGQIVGTGNATGNGASRIESGSLLNRGGHIAANGSALTLTTGELDNYSGSILSAGSGDLTITATSLANNGTDARIIGNGAINLNTGTRLNNTGVISAARALTLVANTIINSGTLGSRADNVNITTPGTLTNTGTISGASAVDIDARTLNNRGGLVQSDGVVSIAVNSLSAGLIYGRDLLLSSLNSIELQNGEQLSASRNMQLQTNGNMTNSGNITAGGTLTIDAGHLTNRAGGVVRSGGNALLDLDRLTNQGTVSSNAVLTLNAANISNSGTVAAGHTLDINLAGNGTISNSNLLFANNLLDIDGNVSNTGNIYSNRDAEISGTTVTNRGGTIAAARDLRISGNILNTYTGEFVFREGETTTTQSYTGMNPNQWGAHEHRDERLTTWRERRTSTIYEAELSGQEGVIAAGRNMWLSGNTTNDLSTISAGGNLDLSGEDFTSISASNQVTTETTTVVEVWGGGCMLHYMDMDGPIGCAEPGLARFISSHEREGVEHSITYIGGSYGTVTAGSITGSLQGKVNLSQLSPLDDLVSGVSTAATGSSGSASRGSNAGAASGDTVTVHSTQGQAETIRTVSRSANGVDTEDTDAVNTNWHDSNAPQLQPHERHDIDGAPIDSALVGTIDRDQRQQDGELHHHNSDPTNVQYVTTEDNSSHPELEGASRYQAHAMHSDVDVQGLGFVSPHLAGMFQFEQGQAPDGPVPQPGGGAGNQGGSGGSNPDPDLILRDMADGQQYTLQQQQGIPAGQQSGQTVFITDEQMRVLTEDLGFDADAINQGQQGLYAAVSQNDLLADGVTLGATGMIDLTADGGFDINSGISAGEGLILRSESGLELGSQGFFDSDNLLGLQLGGDFTNSTDLQSDTLWLDIGGNFTNQGSLTGNDVLSVSAGEDLINQSLISGGHVVLNAGGDIINRTEFSQHTIEYDNGNSRTYTQVGDSPQIVSNDSLSMNAGRNIDLLGTPLAAAGDISLNAGNDILLGAIEKIWGHENYFRGGHDIELHRTYDVASIEAGGNLSVVAGNDLVSEGAQFSAGGTAALAAGNEMNLLAVVESHYDADKTTRRGTFSRRVTESVSLHEEVQGTNITAGNILLNATVDADGNVVQLPGGDITLVGANLDAEHNIIAFGDEITVTAGTYQDYDYSLSSRSRFGGLRSSSHEELAQDDLLSGSMLTAGGNILLDAGNDLHILASDLSGGNIGLSASNEVLIASGEESRIREQRSQSGGFLSGGNLFSSSEALSGSASITADSSVIDASGNLVINAGSATVIGSVLNAGQGMAVHTDSGDIQLLAAQERTETYSYEQTISIGFGDALQALTRPDELISTDNGRLGLRIGHASYDEVDFASSETRHVGTVLNAGDGISLNAAEDIRVEGSVVNAGGDVHLIAGGDVVVTDVTDTYSETLEEVHGSAELSVVVQHQAVEVANAVLALDDATDQLKQAEADYRQYQKDKDQLADTLAQLEADYANNVPGVNYNDIVELRHLLDDVKGDEAWYVAGIATASANVVSKTTLLAQQINAAGNSAGTYGFNAGLQLDIEATKTDSSLDVTSSQASHISGNNIVIATGGDGQSGHTLIQGSHLTANDSLTIATGELDVLAGQDTMRSQSDTQTGTMTVAQTLWGAAGGPTVNASLNSNQQQDRQTTHTNSSLTADNLTVVTTGDATIIGGNLHGATGVSMDIGGDLTLESVQDRFSGSNQGAGTSGGIGFGGVYTNEPGSAPTTQIGATDGVSSVSGGLNASSGRYQSTETVLSSITGGAVDITVDGHTQLTGALIAALDIEGNDTGQLSLTTGSLDFTDLSNRSYSSNQSIGVNANVGVSDAANPADPNQSNSDLALNSSNYSYQNESSQSLDNSLATIGEGTITVGGEDANPSGLNRDTDNLTNDMYAVDRQQGNIDLTVDHRLLSEEGREQIAGDFTAIKDTIGSFIDSLGKLSAEDAALLSDKLGELAQLMENETFDEQMLGDMLAGLEDLEALLLAEQGLLSGEDYQTGDAPLVSGASVAELQQAFDEYSALLNEYYAQGQADIDQSYELGINRGVYAYSQNDSELSFDLGFDLDSAIGFYQGQRESAYGSLGLDAGAAEGGMFDFLGWTAASVTNESWQAAQFLGKSGAYLVTLGSTSSPFDGSGYHSLIGQDTLFGLPQTFAGAVGVEQGVVTSYAAGVEGLALLGLKGVKYAGSVGRVDDALGIPNSGADSAVSGIGLNRQLTAQEVASGHAFDKHVLVQGEFPGITTRPQFQEHVENVLNNPSGMRYYKDGRTVYLQESSGTVVIRNPSTGESTAFQPTDWVEYINSLPSRVTPNP